MQTKSTAVDSKEFPFIKLAGRNVLQMWKNYAMLRFRWSWGQPLTAKTGAAAWGAAPKRKAYQMGAGCRMWPWVLSKPRRTCSFQTPSLPAFCCSRAVLKHLFSMRPKSLTNCLTLRCASLKESSRQSKQLVPWKFISNGCVSTFIYFFFSLLCEFSDVDEVQITSDIFPVVLGHLQHPVSWGG